MNKDSLEFFKSLLSVPTKTHREDLMIEFICNHLDSMEGIDYYLDGHKNIYVRKGVLSENNYYPLFIAHTDTVHELVDEIVVKEERLPKPPTFGRTFSEERHISLKGYLSNGVPTGIGGDDKCGIFIALELLKILPVVKVALFVSEETGCHGSRNCDPEFLNDVGYGIQFDAPGNHLITEVCSGVRLFEKDGEFINKVLPLFEETMGTTPDLQSHPYTDVSQIKLKGDFSCINFSCGYYNMHSSQEFVVLNDVENAIDLSVSLVNELSYDKYLFDINSNKLNANNSINFFDGLDELDEEIYEEEETNNNLIVYFNDSMTISDKLTGDYVNLNKDEMLTLYKFLERNIEISVY